MADKKTPLNSLDSWAFTKLVMNAQTICFSGRLSAWAWQRQLPEWHWTEWWTTQPLFAVRWALCGFELSTRSYGPFIASPPGLPPLCAPVTAKEQRRGEDGHWLHCSCKEGFGVLCAFQSVAQWAKMSRAKEAVCACQWGRGEVRAARGAERHRNTEWDRRERQKHG